MQAFFEFFDGIAKSITSVIDFVIAFFRDFISLLKILAAIPQYLVVMFQWIPGELFVLLTVLISAVILYKILGREG